ncbi:hypothetical protein M9Y10_002456 [Tritrichomonas musculus]|uniref:Syntaxin 6/10/61 N-terminal domain-containing protein n=1 Tax=Tritrichomonas musculus TaxID=1915356 RepID=A0ABR2L9U4_9EUKA
MIDPYPSIKSQISNLVTQIEEGANQIKTLRQGGASVSEFMEAQIQNQINDAEKKLQTIMDVNRAVAEDPSRFNISQEELNSRQNFANTIRQRINNVNNILSTSTTVNKSSPSYASDRKEQLRRIGEDRNQRFIDDEIGHQQQMMQEGDQELDVALGITEQVKQNAFQISNELHEDEIRRNDIEDHMDRTQNTLEVLVEKTKELLDQPRNWMWIGCVVLTIIVIVLIIWVFLF